MAGLLYSSTAWPETPSFRDPAGSVLFLIYVLGLGTLLGSAVEMIAVNLTPGRALSPFWSHWLDWWLDESLGALLVVPAWLTVVHDRVYVKRLLARRHLEFLALFLATLFVSLNIYTHLASPFSTWLIRPYLLFPIIILAAMNLGVLGTTVVMQVTAACVIVGLLTHVFPENGALGPGISSLDQVLLHECVLTALSLTGLVISAALREKDEALLTRDAFLSIASHELKTPVSSLKLQGDLIRRFFTDSPAGNLRIAALLNQSDRQIDRLVRLVDELLDITRIDHGRLTLQLERTDLGELVQDVLRRVTPILHAADCGLTHVAEPGAIGTWDRFRLEQVLTNLLTNAARYGAGKPVQITTEASGSSAILRVSDQGRGIASGDHERIFGRFERVTPTDISGLGVGLFIVKQIVEMHEGSISLESELGKGSTFVVRLPLR